MTRTSEDFLDPFANERMPEQREKLVKIFVPELFYRPGTLLYIGASPDRFACGKMLTQAGHEITVVEVWGDYVEALEVSPQREHITHLLQGDVLTIDKLDLPYERYDFAFWWHGPEHILRMDFGSVVCALERLTNQVVVLSSTWGEADWSTEDDNPYMNHLSYLYPSDYERLGYRTVAVWPKDRPGSHLMAWKVFVS